MSTVVLGSAKASPGVTTSALALAAVWPQGRRVLVVEADPDGGVLSARCGLGPEPGLATLAVSGRRSLDVDEFDRHLRPFPGEGVAVLVGPPSAEQSRRALDLIASPLARLLGGLSGTDVLIDAGRLGPTTPAWPLVDAADAVLLVARPRLEELQLLPARLRGLRATVRRVGVLLVGELPYPGEEVASALDVEVVGVLADDQRTAAALAGEGRGARLGRSLLLRSAREVVEALGAWTGVAGDSGVSAHVAGDAAGSGVPTRRADAEVMG